ncbi:MAG: hypothetical protein HYX75_23415 [Acidobacteria bacterium]|nr:hypothetical protein [Acidobacteriota bacterium]
MKARRMRLLRGFSAVIAVSVLLNGCAIANKMSGVSQARELQKKGVSAEAEILEIWDTGISVNENPVVGLLLEVRPADGRAYQAKTKALVSRVHIPMVQPGLVVPVWLDPADPTRVSLAIYEY